MELLFLFILIIKYKLVLKNYANDAKRILKKNVSLSHLNKYK